MTINLAALKSELLTDPAARGYAAHIGGAAENCTILAGLLNAPAVSTIPVASVATADAIACIEESVYTALSAARKAWFGVICTQDRIMATAQIKPFFGQAFSGATLTRLQALTDRPGTRAEFLFGEGAVVDENDISKALRLP